MRFPTTARIAATVVTSLSLLSTAFAEDIHSAILGSWILSEWSVTGQNGSVVYPYGPNAEGMIIYTDDGHMAVQLANPDAKAEEVSRIEDRYFAYFGTYTIDEAAGTVTHTLEGSLTPSWVGTEQVRAYQLTDQKKLKLIALIPPDDALAETVGAGGENTLVWKRSE